MYMKKHDVGMTEFYNRIHDPNNSDFDILEFRELRHELNYSVISSYGFDHIDLQIGFHEVGYLPDRDCVRFTISEAARLEVLGRLAELNRQRYQEEVDQKLHGGTSGLSKERVRRSRSASAAEPTLDLDDILPTTIEGGG